MFLCFILAQSLNILIFFFLSCCVMPYYTTQIIRQIRAVKAGVLELGGDLERDGNPVLKNQRLTVGSRPYMLIPQKPGEYREGQWEVMEAERLRLLEEERLRLLRLNDVTEEEVESVEEVVDKSMAGRHEESGIADIMKELDVVTKFGATLKMFAPSGHVKPLDVIDPFEEQDRLEREAEEKKLAQEKLFEHLLTSAMSGAEELLLEEAVIKVFVLGYSELPPLLPLGYHRLSPPTTPTFPSSTTSGEPGKNNKKLKKGKHKHRHQKQQQQEQEANALLSKRPYGYQKIARDDPYAATNSLVLFNATTNNSGNNHNQTDSSLCFSKSLPSPLPLPLPRVNQADLQCRHDSDLNYAITYQIKTGKRYTSPEQQEDYTLAFSNITDMPNPKPPRKVTSRQGTYALSNRPATTTGTDMVIFDKDSAGRSSGDSTMLAIADSNMQSNALITNNSTTNSSALVVANSIQELEKEQERQLEIAKESSLSQLGSVYIEKQHAERRLKEPDWMLMQHRLRLNESIHTEKFVTFEIVSMAKNIELRDTQFIMNKPIIRFGTLDACDYTIKCSNNAGGDIRKERTLSKIHCMVYVPLIPPRSQFDNGSTTHADFNRNSGAAKTKKYRKSYDSDSESDSDEEAERASREKRAGQVTIVDNHSCWGTYVVTQQGVKKVPTTIQAGIPLEHGDLICMGIARHGPSTMTPLEANRALLVFRVRTDYCVTIGKVPEFDVGEMIMHEQAKSEKKEKAEFR